MYLQEVLNKPFPYKWTSKNPRQYVAQFSLSDGEEDIIVMFDNLRLTSDKAIKTLNVPEDMLGSFGYDVSFAKGNRFDVTGEGNGFRTFATIKNIFFEFMKIAKPVSFITFTAKESSRQKLYDRMAKMLAHKYMWNIYYGKGESGKRYTLAP